MARTKVPTRLVGGGLAALMCLALLTVPAGAQATPLEVVRHAGPTRTHTAAAVSQQSHPDGAETVILARADTYGDALAAAPLAAAINAPVLLTPLDRLDDSAVAEMTRLGASHAILLGDLGRGVEDDVRTLGVTDVQRITGGDQWATFAAIAAAVVQATGNTDALLVEGSHADADRGWPDALAASAWAARTGRPILLTTADALPDATRQAINDLGLTGITAVGGTVAVSAGVLSAAQAVLGAPVGRVAGDSRYDTAIAVAAQNLDEFGYTPSVWVASGRSWPDAVVAGPAVGKSGGVLVLSDPVTPAYSRQTHDFINGQRGFASTAHLVGGTAVLSVDVQTAIQTGAIQTGAIQTGAIPPIPGQDTTDSSTPDPVGDRPPAVPATNTAPPIEGALPWSDPATWGGSLPQTGDTVTIPADRAVLLDIPPPALRGIQVEGTLTVADIDMRIDVDWIAVTGRLAIGTEQRPLTRRVEIVIHPKPGDDLRGAGSGPIVVDGGTLDIHGQTPVKAWTRLARTAVAGTTLIELEQAPGWAVGDVVVIASTSLEADQAEERTVVATDGPRVTLDRPLTHTHWGQTDQLGGVDVRQHAEVGSLSRNILIRSDEASRASRMGGHILVYQGSVARIQGVELVGLGQAGQTARYPVHFHMMGNASGSYVRGASIHHANNRCVTIHASDYIDVRDTIGYETFGHCFFFEDGVETGNTMHRNLGLSTRRPSVGLQLLPSDAEPATFWITNPTNHFVQNAAAGSEGNGFWYDLPESPTGLSSGTELDIRHLPFGTFADNVAHSSMGEGWKNGVGVFVEDYEPPTPAVMTDLTVYKNVGFGSWSEGNEIHRSVLAENSIGFLGLDAALRDSTVVGATSNSSERSWRVTGVGFYHRRSQITDVTFVNFGVREHDWQHPRRAMEFMSTQQNEISEVSGAKFVNADRLAIVQPPSEDGEPDLRMAAIRDLDGSIAGAPSVLASNHPLMHDQACTWRAELSANVCPVDYQRTWLMVRNVGNQDIGGGSLTRDDGAVGAMYTPDSEPERAVADILLNRAYRLSTGNTVSQHVEVIMAGPVEGHVDLTIPWPYPTAFVYDGWGRWQEVPSVGALFQATDSAMSFDPVAGVLRVRHTVDNLGEKGDWQRLELCAQAFCGNPGPG